MTYRLVLLAGLATLALGCAKRHRILNPTVQRAPVVFESSQAAETFEDALDDHYDEGEGQIAAIHAQLSPNAFFNREVMDADDDGDGIISEQEAARYAER